MADAGGAVRGADDARGAGATAHVHGGRAVGRLRAFGGLRDSHNQLPAVDADRVARRAEVAVEVVVDSEVAGPVMDEGKVV